MTIATEKIKPESSRWTLVRFSPVRDVAQTFAEVSEDVFEATWPLDAPIYDLQFAEDVGFPLTRVDSATNNGEWSYDEETGVIRVVLTGATLEELQAEVLLAYYYLFYCSHPQGDFPYYEDPDDVGSTIRNWRGRLQSDPVIESQFSDILSGVFSISNSTFSILNIDRDFEQFLGEDDSFYLRDVTAWLFINGEKQRTFTGKVASLTIGSEVALNVLDSFTKLDTDAWMGDEADDVLVPTSAAPDDIGKPIPLLIAGNSFYQKNDATDVYVDSTEAGEWIDGLPAVCTDYTPNGEFAIYNREWTLCRALDSLATQTFGTLVRATAIDSFDAAFQFSSYTNLRIGDTLHWVDGVDPEWGRIVALGNFTYSGLAYNVRVTTTGSSPPVASASSVVTPQKCLSLWVEGAESDKQTQFDLVYLYQTQTYTITEDALASGHTLIRVTLADNMESDVNIALADVVDPTRMKLKYSIRTTTTLTDLKHATVLESMIESANIATDSASFTQANSDLIENVAFMIPYRDETSFSTYRKYVTDLLAGTLGYVSLNGDDEAVYQLLDVISAGDLKDENITLGDGLQANIEYQDIVSAITPDNQHLPFIGTKTLTKYTSRRAQVLHGVTNEIQMQHVMETVAPIRIQSIVALRGERRVLYTYESATDDIDTLLGQDVTVESPGVLGGSGTESIKVTGLSKEAGKTQVTATDLLGV